MSEVLQTIAKRSSTRKFKEQPLTKEQILQLVDAGLQAPTARNEQEVHICVVAGDSPLLQEIEEEKQALILNNANTPNNFYYSAPTVFILSADKDFRWSKVDAGICVENMALAAEAMGLGSLIIGSIYDALYNEKKAYFEQKLCFPQNHEYAIALAVGYKDMDKAPHEFDRDKNVTFIM